METYFKIKSFVEFGVPLFLVALFVLIILAYIIIAIVESHKENKIKKYMLANGYEHYLRDVASFGGKCWYAYRKDDIRIDEEKLYKMSFHQVKKEFKWGINKSKIKGILEIVEGKQNGRIKS